MAVTSNRGTGRAPLRPGADPLLEWRYYQNRVLKGRAGTHNELSFKSQCPCRRLLDIAVDVVIIKTKAEKQLDFSFKDFKVVRDILKQNLNVTIQMTDL